MRLLLAGLFAGALLEFAQSSREATLAVRILDAATGQPTPVRVRLQNETGERPKVRGAVAVSESAIPIPRQAIAVMFGQSDQAQGYAIQPDGSFYVDGAFDVRLPPGTYTLAISKGFEYLRETQAIDLKPATAVKREYKMRRWMDMPARGWYSADDHIHLRRSPADNHAIAQWLAAEDVHVGNLLRMGDFWQTFFAQYAFGERGRYTEAGRLLSPGQEEPRTPEIGHTISLGASDFVRMQPDYYSYDKLFDRVHQLGGVTGFAHQAMSFNGYRGMALNTLRGKTDFLELAQFCVPEGPLAVQHYYQFLDMGFKLTALAGSDFPWCGLGPQYGFTEPQFAQIGNARFYAYTGGALTFEHYMAALKAGHTFVTTGPILFLTVNGKMPGDTVDVPSGGKLKISAEAYGNSGQVPLRSVEIVGHGKVLARSEGKDAAHLALDLELPVDRGIWIAAKCDAGQGQVAHTTPVYVTVNGGGFQNVAAMRRNLDVAEGYLKEVEQDLANPPNSLDRQAPRHRAQLERQIAEARTQLKSMATR
ncbi:MAG: CehA/McbA family metallohydrolase [Candidatus Solibacter sp.]|nr:CehA/McbA family metallohydrolase [Candidatus Solibacter sp.]